MAVESPPQSDIISDGSFLPSGRKVSSRAILEHRLVRVDHLLSNHQDLDTELSVSSEISAKLQRQRSRTMSALGIEGNPESPKVVLLIAGIKHTLQEKGLPYWRSQLSIKRIGPQPITIFRNNSHVLDPTEELNLSKNLHERPEKYYTLDGGDHSYDYENDPRLGTLVTDTLPTQAAPQLSQDLSMAAK